METIRHLYDARTGQVAVTWKPVSTSAFNIVSQPVVRSMRPSLSFSSLSSSSAPLSTSSCLKA